MEGNDNISLVTRCETKQNKKKQINMKLVLM
jgi:hypothetical protein